MDTELIMYNIKHAIVALEYAHSETSTTTRPPKRSIEYANIMLEIGLEYLHKTAEKMNNIA